MCSAKQGKYRRSVDGQSAPFSFAKIWTLKYELRRLIPAHEPAIIHF
jgi:hypothetical protein